MYERKEKERKVERDREAQKSKEREKEIISLRADIDEKDAEIK
ncbi:hypothetical protein EZS27_040660 [termite gut metagenome]|uniref:Uncharacterized protein n=1 Tax=termite gut metagenome TaxID=433724 RepID=A0A5J4PDX5_9ZZZZ